MNDYGRRLERGIALPLALLILVGLGFVATGAVFFSNTDMKISSSYSASNTALAAAEAGIEHGIAELSARARAGQDPDNVQIISHAQLGRFTYDVRAYSKLEQGSDGSGVSGGGDDDDDEEDDDEGGAGRDLNGDGDRNDVVRYDQSFGYQQARASGEPGDEGDPVKILVARARDGKTAAEVRVEVAREGLFGGMNGPLTMSSPSNAILSGTFEVNGRLFRRDGTPVGSGSLTPTYGLTANSKSAAKTKCNYWKAGIKIPAEGSLALTGSLNARGHVAFDHGLTGNQNYDAEDSLKTFKFTPEEVLGIEAGSLDRFKKDAASVDFDNLSGVNYIVSGEIPSQLNGSGILIVHNPRYDVKKYDCANFPTTCSPSYRYGAENQPLKLKINANGQFTGMIIVDELIRINGNFLMYGGLASLTTEPVNIPANGTGALRWSCEAVRDAMGLTGDYSIRLSWEHSQL